MYAPHHPTSKYFLKYYYTFLIKQTAPGGEGHEWGSGLPGVWREEQLL